MSVQSEITRIQNAVQGAIAAIEDKGVSVSDDAGVDDLAALIASIICPDVSKVTAAAGNVLEGKVFVDANGNAVTGTMTNQGAVSTTVEAGGTYTIPAGYHNGSGKVTGAASGGAYQVVHGTKTVAGLVTSITVTHNFGKNPVLAVIFPISVSSTAGYAAQAMVVAWRGVGNSGRGLVYSVSGGGVKSSALLVVNYTTTTVEFASATVSSTTYKYVNNLTYGYVIVG